MAYGSSDLVRTCCLDGHVSDQVGDITHLLLLTGRLDDGRTVRELLGLRTERYLVRRLRIERLQPIQRRGTGDRAPVVGDDHDRITIEVCTRETLSHLRVDDYSISSSTALTEADQILRFSCLVVDHEIGDLERTCMRVAHQGHSLTVVERGSEDLGGLDLVRGK